MAKRIEVAEKIVIRENKRVMRELKLHHKMLFAFIVFFAAVLLWYGIWTIISDIPIINNPYVASVLGVFILVITGSYYSNTL